MQKQLGELSKEQLISIIQDYQEMIFDIQSVLNVGSDESIRNKIKEIFEKVL